MLSPRGLTLLSLFLASFSLLSRAFDDLSRYNATGSYDTTGVITVPDQTPQLIYGVSSRFGTGSEAYELKRQIALGSP